MPLGPTVRRRRLGAELRRLREANSLKLEEVAEQLGLAPSTLSRIETGKAPTKTAYLTSMLGMYGVDDPAVRKVLVDMAREGHRKGWWSIYDDVLPSGFDIYVGLEAEASGLRSYETDLVHGLLQTTEYALAVLRELRPRDSDEQILRGVDLRMQRQRLLDHDPPLDLWLILDEGAIRRNIGGAKVMRNATRAPDPGQPVVQRDPPGPGLRSRRACGAGRVRSRFWSSPSAATLRWLTPNRWAA